MTVSSGIADAEAPSDLDFVAGPIDFTELSPVDFEHLVFHLLDELGYQEIVWRKGGPGNSANDQGRDLEATCGAEGFLGTERRRFWFEVKYRRQRLETSIVQNTITNALAQPDLDTICVITNASVSNACLDWAREFSTKHGVGVELCQGHDLERLLRGSPKTMLRFFRGVLSFSGQCKAIAARFVHRFLLPGPEELHLLFGRRGDIEQPAVLAAACLAESAHGDPEVRRWGVVLTESALLGALGWTLHKLDELASVADLRGHSHRPLFSGLAYMISSLLSRGLADSVTEVLRAPERFLVGQPPEAGAAWRAYRTSFALRALLSETGEHCSMDCAKLSTGNELRGPSSYFIRFAGVDTALTEPRLVVNSARVACPIGVVSKGSFCPLGRSIDETGLTDAEVESVLHFVGRVLSARGA